MHCTNCGAELADGSVFCTNCGAQMGESEPTTFCTSCGSTVPASAVVCPTCGQAMESPAPAKKSFDLMSLTEKLNLKDLSPKKLIIFGGIAVAAILVIVLLCSLLGSTSPQDGLDNLLTKGNFTVIAKVDDEKYEINIDMNLKKHELTLYAEIEDEIYAIYDEEYIYYDSYYEYGYTEDISDELDAFFEAYENADKSDWEEVADTLSDLLNIDVEDYVDIKQFDKCMDSYEKKLENKSWLKKNAGYSTETKSGVKYHTYEPNLFTFATASLECFEKAFEDDDLYDDLMDYLKEYKSMLKAVKPELRLGVKGKYLVSAQIEIAGEDFKVTVEDIGKTEISEKKIDKLLDKIESSGY